MDHSGNSAQYPTQISSLRLLGILSSDACELWKLCSSLFSSGSFLGSWRFAFTYAEQCAAEDSKRKLSADPQSALCAAPALWRSAHKLWLLWPPQQRSWHQGSKLQAPFVFYHPVPQPGNCLSAVNWGNCRAHSIVFLLLGSQFSSLSYMEEEQCPKHLILHEQKWKPCNSYFMFS